MGLEIERKFLVHGEDWRKPVKTITMKQGYLVSGPLTVRVRIEGDRAVLALKKDKARLVRHEYEYEIPIVDAEAILTDLCEDRIVEKKRHYVEWDGLTWEVDEFEGNNRGLVLAEVELEDPNQSISPPPWAGEEVSDDPRYYNAYLAEHPYSAW